MSKTTSDPAWLKSMKKEADKLGIPLRELLTQYQKKDKAKKSTTMKAAKGGYSKKKK